MCTTAMALAVTAVAAVASGVVTAETQRESAKYEAESMRQQAKNEEKSAVAKYQEGIEEARRKKLHSILAMGSEKTNLASNNISLNSQTSMNIIDDKQLTGELDALSTLKKANYTSGILLQRANSYYSNAALTSFKAGNNYKSDLLKITSSNI